MLLRRMSLAPPGDCGPPHQREPLKTLVSHEVNAALTALWRARQAESTPKLLCYLPFMAVFEAATGIGFFAGFVGGQARRRALKRVRRESSTPAVKSLASNESSVVE